MDQNYNINPPEEPRPDDTEQEEDSEEEDESTEKEEGEDEEHQTRTTRSGKAYNVEFHPSYFAMTCFQRVLFLQEVSLILRSPRLP